MNPHYCKIALLLYVLVSTVSWADNSNEQALKRGKKMAVSVCVSCHGVDGRSESSQFPNLAGQQAIYLENQLRDFKHHIRAEPDAHEFMWGVAALLDDELITGLALHFQHQVPAPGDPTGTKLTEKGDDIFHHGIPARNINACASCHGAYAEGKDSYPRLTGQHSAYLLRQLRLIQSNARNIPTMHDAIKDLSPEEMEAIVAYLHSL